MVIWCGISVLWSVQEKLLIISLAISYCKDGNDDSKLFIRLSWNQSSRDNRFNKWCHVILKLSVVPCLIQILLSSKIQTFIIPNIHICLSTFVYTSTFVYNIHKIFTSVIRLVIIKLKSETDLEIISPIPFMFETFKLI